MTYGELRFRLTKLAPGVDPDLIEGWIDDRYMEILDRLSWTRLRVESVLQTVAPYATGTVSMTNGLNTVALAGGAWSSAMTGRAFRVDGQQEYYEFTRTGALAGTLDRVYEGETAAGLAYRIFQNIYPLPAALRILEEIRSFTLGPLDKFSKAQLNASVPSRPAYGVPRVWTPYMDDSSDPPQPQVELYPIPDAAIGLPFSYIADKAALSAGAATATLLPWLRPAAMVAGCEASILRHLKEWIGARLAGEEFERQISLMLNNEAKMKGPTRIRMASRFTRHRLARSLGSAANSIYRSDPTLP